MIKLMDIVNELSFPKGDASNYPSSHILKAAVDNFIGKNKSYYLDDNTYTGINEKASVSNFVKEVKKYIVSEKGSNKLIARKYGEDIEVVLIDASAPSIDLVCIGRMSLGEFFKNSKKNKFPKIYQVHWSIVADEYLRADFGKLMYFLTFDYISSLGAYMASDSTLFSGSFRMWTKFMPSVVPYFGIILGYSSLAVLPISKDEIQNITKKTGGDILGIIGMKEYPPEMAKINKAVSGLSFTNGDYAYCNLADSSINTKEKFFYIRDKKDSNGADVSFIEVVNYANKEKWKLENFIDFIKDETYKKIITTAENYKKLNLIIYKFTDATLCIKEQNKKIVVIKL